MCHPAVLAHGPLCVVAHLCYTTMFSVHGLHPGQRLPALALAHAPRHASLGCLQDFLNMAMHVVLCRRNVQARGSCCPDATRATGKLIPVPGILLGVPGFRGGCGGQRPGRPQRPGSLERKRWMQRLQRVGRSGRSGGQGGRGGSGSTLLSPQPGHSRNPDR